MYAHSHAVLCRSYRPGRTLTSRLRTLACAAGLFPFKRPLRQCRLLVRRGPQGRLVPCVLFDRLEAAQAHPRICKGDDHKHGCQAFDLVGGCALQRAHRLHGRRRGRQQAQATSKVARQDDVAAAARRRVSASHGTGLRPFRIRIPPARHGSRGARHARPRREARSLSLRVGAHFA